MIDENMTAATTSDVGTNTDAASGTGEARQSWRPEAEQEARALGWKSPDEWSGNIPAGYIDNPERYLERAETFTPFRKLREKLAETERATEERLRRIESVAEKAVSRIKAENEAKLAEIRAEKIKAVELADTDTYRELDKREQALVKAEADDAASTQRTQTGPDPEAISAIEAWRKDKPWFGKDAPEFNAVMTRSAADLWSVAEARGMTNPKEILAFVDAQLRDAFPHKFAASNGDARRQASVEGGLSLGGGGGADDFARLPQDAKDAFKRLVAKGLFKDDKEGRATYVRDYNDAA